MIYDDDDDDSHDDLFFFFFYAALDVMDEVIRCFSSHNPATCKQLVSE